MFAVGVLGFNVREERCLVQEDLGAVDALQVGSVGQLGVSGEDVFLQLVRLAEGLLAVIAHIQVLLQVSVSSRSLLPAVPLAPQGQVLSVLAVSLARRGEGQGVTQRRDVRNAEWKKRTHISNHLPACGSAVTRWKRSLACTRCT